jgi:hypothetical protein
MQVAEAIARIAELKSQGEGNVPDGNITDLIGFDTGDKGMQSGKKQRAKQALEVKDNTGGIDLNAMDRTLEISAEDGAAAMKFNVSPAVFERYRSANGFVPADITVTPDLDFKAFFGAN